MPKGSVFKQCSCRDDHGARLGARCPRLHRPGGSWHPTHGWWSYQIELPPDASGHRRQLRRGHFPRSDDAIAEVTQVQQLLSLAHGDTTIATRIGDLLAPLRATQPLPDAGRVARRVGALGPVHGTLTVAEYLTAWHAGRRGLSPTTLEVYGGHIRHHLIPHLGTIPLDELRAEHIGAMIDAILDRNTRIEAARSSDDPTIRATVVGMRTVCATTLHRIRATLRKALNDAIRIHRYLDHNPATHVEMPPGKRPKARVWTPPPSTPGTPAACAPAPSWSGPPPRPDGSSTTPKPTTPSSTPCTR